MEKFLKPVQKIIPKEHIVNYICEIMDNGLTKDLKETESYQEEICECCRGTNIVIADNPFGLKGDPNKRKMFPYKHQSFTFCQNCYNGVVRRCKYCGKLIKHGFFRCDCETQKNIEKLHILEDKRKYLEAASTMPDDEAEKYDGAYFSDYYPYNGGFFYDWDEFFNEVDEKSLVEKPNYVWATLEIKAHIDVANWIEEACSDLYEEAFQDVSNEDIAKLQSYVDCWLKKSMPKGIKPDFKTKIRIPWERYKKEV